MKTLNAASMQRAVAVEGCASDAYDSVKVRERETKRSNCGIEGSQSKREGAESEWGRAEEQQQQQQREQQQWEPQQQREELRRERRMGSASKEVKVIETVDINRKYEKLLEEHNELKETVSAERRENKKDAIKLQ
jgi:hypothetical protein